MKAPALGRPTPSSRIDMPPIRARWRLDGVLKRLVFAWHVHRERRALEALSEADLKDIGLSRSQASREASRAFLDLPDQCVEDRRRRDLRRTGWWDDCG